MTDRNLLFKVLDQLEDVDARNLVWGLTEETWTEERLLRRISDAAPAHDPNDMLTALLEHKLVFRIAESWPQEYRTRMAEAMRLLAHLRQQFANRPWQISPSLVADFRFRHEARKFPKRDQTAANLADELTAHGVVQEVVDAAVMIASSRDNLSQFQIDAAVKVFEAMKDRDAGVIVSAGTGSGKTLAFYLPALAYLATRPQKRGVGVVAIYPRNELLKDQLAAALDETRALKVVGGRSLRIGAYFGPTPTSAGSRDGLARKKWKKTESGWICPFLSCRAEIQPRTRCGGQLIWQAEDYAKRIERLRCAQCGDVVSDDEVALTRKSMIRKPPDLLFTTTEMLNRSLSNGQAMHVFGVGPKAECTPALILLDEVHTYEGTNGAQAAYLLRRWRNLLGSPITWVGLSATLANADRFFTDLCGLAEGVVREVRPSLEHMDERGREYQVVLRGDPAARTSLLSTTIQTIMLARRVLDQQGQGIGAYGSRVFAFCDNLDIVNRLFRQYLSAEGLTPFGKRDPRGVPLADLRMKHAAQLYGRPVTDWTLRDADGQKWWMPEELGFAGKLLKVDRTSSQDSGVSTTAEVVVATASLEVGFDDPEVGAVVQHKAPRDIAQFLQRRGRAGRTQIQRPWTLVVLSDYGRDRAAYQDYETLLDPALPERRLPLGNQSVRKMQAAMCLIDWAAQRLDVANRRNDDYMRKVFVQPAADKDYAGLCTEVVALLREVLEGGEARAHLMRFLAASLHLTPDEVATVCWEQPRSLLLDTVPTAVRRLSSRWAAYDEGRSVPEREPWVDDSPLPEFIPKALFSDLCLPEVAVTAPEGYDTAANTSVGVQMALTELAPGKVTLRWAVHDTRGLWIEPAADGHSLALEDGLARSGGVLRAIEHNGSELQIIRPYITAPTITERSIQTKSNGRLRWQLQYEPAHAGIDMTRPRTGPLGPLVPSVTAYLHAGRGALRTWRYAVESTSGIVRRSGPKEQVTNTFTWRGQPAAVGYEALVDAQLVSLAAPASLSAFRLDTDQPRLRQLRRDYFTDDLRTALHALAVDPFLSRRIADTVIAAVALNLREGQADSGSIAPQHIAWRHSVDAVLDSGAVDLGEEEDDSHEADPHREELLEVLDNPHIAALIDAAVPNLVSEPDEAWLLWLQRRWVHTFAAAWQMAAQALCPEFDVDDDSCVDVVAIGETATFILSDASIGGGGLIEALTTKQSEDPRRFDHLVAAALQPSDLEEVDRSLRRTLELLRTNPDVTAAAAEFRASERDRLLTWQHLLAVLSASGVSTAHATVATLASRIFRPGTSTGSDELLSDCIRRWDTLEERVGFAVDHRAICDALAAEAPLRAALGKAVPGGGPDDRKWATSVLLGLLWPRAEARRTSTLQGTNRFIDEATPTERTLVLDSLPDPVNEVDVDAAGWESLVEGCITQTGRCRLFSGHGDPNSLKRALQYLATDPIELGWLQVHPRVEAAARADGRLTLEVSLEEAPQ